MQKYDCKLPRKPPNGFNNSQYVIFDGAEPQAWGSVCPYLCETYFENETLLASSRAAGPRLISCASTMAAATSAEIALRSFVSKVRAKFPDAAPDFDEDKVRRAPIAAAPCRTARRQAGPRAWEPRRSPPLCRPGHLRAPSRQPSEQLLNVFWRSCITALMSSKRRRGGRSTLRRHHLSSPVGSRRQRKRGSYQVAR